jgi:probable addiction module antidote protein
MKLHKLSTSDYNKARREFETQLRAAYDRDPGDGTEVCKTLGAIARAYGMTEIARETGLSRVNLYRAFSGTGNPEFSTVLKVMRVLGLRTVPGVR